MNDATRETSGDLGTEALFVDRFADRIVRTLHEPLLLLDADLRVRHVNPSYCRTFQASADEAVGTSLFELSGGQWQVPELEECLGRVLEEDESFEGLEVDRVFPDIGHRVMRLNGRQLLGEGGESQQILLAIEDITDRRELERELKRHARELERSNVELEQFAYAASHDLQEPLRMVASYLQLLESRYRDDLGEEAREFIDYAVDGARRMKSLLNGLLEYSRVGRKEGEFGEVDLGEVLSEVLEDLSRRIEELDAEVSCAPLPTCRGNHDQLRRLLQNLIENALTYRGESPPRIEVRGEERPEGGVQLTVQDQGPGIPAEHREKVFQIFHQLNPHGDGREGSGIGLALCRKIAERHGGDIRIESEPGEGAAVHLTIDLAPQEGS